jgi:hypothetical protein
LVLIFDIEIRENFQNPVAGRKVCMKNLALLVPMPAMQAKVCLDAIKWQCGKENAKRYTDVTRVAHTDTHGNDIEKLPDADLDNEINRLVINIGIQVVQR